MGQRINRDRLKKMIELDWPPSVALGFRLTPAEALKLDDIAEARGTTLSVLASRLIKDFLKEEEDAKGREDSPRTKDVKAGE